MKEFLKKALQTVAGRLLLLRKKCNKAALHRHGALLRMRLQILWLRLKLLLEEGICWILAATVKIRRCLTRENLRLRYDRTVLWAKEHLTREKLKGYAHAGILRLREFPKQCTKENLKKWALSAWRALCRIPGNLRKNRGIALLISTAMLAFWLYLGTATSMAWLTYTAPVKRNTFQVGQMDLTVEYRRPEMTDYEEVTEDTRLFSDEALYEPGYTQLVYLRMGNEGDVPFDYEITVRDFLSVDSVNVYGDVLHLPEHLRFGLITASSELELERKAAQAIAAHDMEEYCHRLGAYSKRGTPLDDGQKEYAALVVYMPEETGNEANYRGEVVPQVSLGVTIHAQQAGTMDLE